MADDSDVFGVYIHHGGSWRHLGKQRMYLGGEVKFVANFEKDRFGFFDVQDEIKKLGYVDYEDLEYKVPKTKNYYPLYDDIDCMMMLQSLSPSCKYFEVFLHNGVKDDMQLGRDQVQKEAISLPKEGGKGKGLQIEAGKGKGDSTAKGKGLQKPGLEKDKGDSTAKGKGLQKQGLENEKGDVSAKGKGIQKHALGKEKVDSTAKGKSLQKKGIGKGREQDAEGVAFECQTLTDSEDDQLEPEDVIEQIETDDSLGDSELGSEDEEYKAARVGVRLQENVIADVNWNEIPEQSNAGMMCRLVDEAEGGVDSGCTSDYIASDEDVFSDSTDDDDDDGQRQKRRPRVLYDPKCDHKELEPRLGMRFETGYQCKEALRTWAIFKGYPLHFRRVQKKTCEALCTPPCKWRCYGSMSKRQDVFKLKILEGEPHTCGFAIHTKLANYKWIASQYLNHFRLRPNMDIGELQADIIERYGIEPSRGRLYRAKTEALELLRGSVSQHYASLRPYILELMRVDPEGRFELLTDGGVFKGLYIGFSALKKGFMQGCRWILGLDGCFLKTHLGGQLLSAIAKDANDQMYPLAWAVVEVENEQCWTWFLSILLQELGVEDGLGISFISDQQKGLINAVQNLAPFAEHRNCARHVYCNWKKEFKGPTLKNLFWKAARSTYEEQWEAALEEMKGENEAAYEDFKNRDYKRFCKVFLCTEFQNDMVDNNISETFNGYIVKARSKHLVNMLEDIRIALMERQVKKLQLIEKCEDRICPAIKKKLEKLMVSARMCIAHPGVGQKFEVQRLDDKFVVSLSSRSCTCRAWNLSGVPCVHAISAINYMKHDPQDYVHDAYTVEKYKKSYSYALEPINGEKMWPKATGDPVLPPLVRIMPGRPKKKRRREHDEVDPKKSTRLRKIGGRITCQNCLQVGHNARGCKNEKVTKPQKEKGTRGRPRKTAARTSVGNQSVLPDGSKKRARRGSKTGKDAGNQGEGQSGQDASNQTSSQGEILTQHSQVTE